MHTFTGILDFLLGVVLIAGAITKWSFYGAFAEKFPARDKPAFRIAAGIMGGLLILLGVVMLVLG